MRQDKLTTKFQEALADAQSLALAGDHAYIEPQHLLAALLKQPEGPRALLERAGVNVGALASAVDSALQRLPQVHGQEQVQVGRDLVTLLQATEKEALKRGDQFIASELFLLVLAVDKGETARLLKQHGGQLAAITAAVDAVRGGELAEAAPDAGRDAEAHRG